MAPDHRVRNEQRHWACFHRSDGHWHYHLADGPVGIDEIHFFIIYTIFNDHLSGEENSELILLFSREICGTGEEPSYKSLLTVCSLEEFTCSDGEQHQHGTNAKQREQEKVKLKSFSGACISMDRRCDQFPNCKDFSDEESIDLVLGNYF